VVVCQLVCQALASWQAQQAGKLGKPAARFGDVTIVKIRVDSQALVYLYTTK